ncbi:sugar ABC transporter ATP-binding protein [Parasphaerochaeta coccoides]|uniref:Monosaccharide ABC transporter ATP-binding protein, CUT2 family n=1 Tax=Parasphaerochaeta coccoides (strain ATCC BAA-1237 / DSM 17374 / SPN1) TaxID=760011 RepID=F4GJJ4_PARC1|nr:sugar ABC transporter ATP-binding protein [Parasphaerochaeta coccoides]AEC02259.1 monosaccharide ABC transporter ATP-binding protein, CUT2 family [Parasphaerochaeta coccoides DSM 17374]
MEKATCLEMKNITKYFGGVHALNKVSLTLRSGEVHALVGENGAGKSTLMKILIGLHQSDDGDILLDGNNISFRNVKDAQNAGISMIFQEFNQVKVLSVMENIYLGREPKTRTGAVDYKKMYQDSEALLSELGVDLDPKVKIRDLTVAKYQLVEIVKAISLNARIIIMDEPTSALSRNEIEYLLNMVRRLRDQGKCIVFISHKMDEIFGVCERVTVLRDGNLIHTGIVSEISEKELIRHMVDREVKELFPKQKTDIGDTVLEVENLSVAGKFNDVCFELHSGEILGIAGLMGAGRTELVETIFGMRKPDKGEIFLRGEKIVNRIPGDAIKRGIVMLSEDRKRNGVFLKLSIRNNILLSSLKKCMKYFFIRKKIEDHFLSEYTQKLEIKYADDSLPCKNLSGGNQQKVAIARVLNADPDIIILDEPTRGIDVKTKSEIHRLMSHLASTGKAILMVSSELPEILGMSDRILVLHEGMQTGILDRKNATAEKIMALAVSTRPMEV